MCDTETGGLKAYTNGICSLFIKKYMTLEESRFFFYPQKKIYDFAALQVNNLSFNELREKGKSRDKFIDFFNNICETHNKQQGYITFVGWNSSFDLDFISQIYKDKGQKLKSPILNLDLLDIYRANVPKIDNRKKEPVGVENYKLTTVYQFFFNDYMEEFAHTDIYDVYMVQQLLELAVKNKWLEFE